MRAALTNHRRMPPTVPRGGQDFAGTPRAANLAPADSSHHSSSGAAAGEGRRRGRATGAQELQRQQRSALLLRA